MKRNKNILLALLLSVSLNGFSQTYLTLEEYQKKVVDYSQQLKQAKEQTMAATAKKKADKTGFLPKLDASAYGTIDLTNLNLWDSPLGTYHPYNYFAGGTVTQSIWAGGAIENQYRSDKIQENISFETEQLTLENIYLQADQVYWLVAANADLLNISRQYYNIIKSQYNIINERFIDGAIAKNDLLMIITRLTEADLSVKKAESGYLVSVQNMNILMGINPNNQSDSTESILKPLSLPAYYDFEQALENRTDYRIAKLKVDLAQKSRLLALSKFNPQISLQLQGGWGTSNPNLGASPQGTVLSTISFSMPIWHWGERKQVNSQYKANINSSLYNQQIVNDNINKEVANAYTKMDQSYMQINVAKENLKYAQEALDLNTFSYNEGKISMADLLSSQLSWIQAYNNLINAHYSYKVAVAQYKNAVGMSVPKE